MAREAEFAGQLVTVGAQLKTVRIEVVRTVKVVRPPPTAPDEPFTWAVTEAAPEADRGRTVEAGASTAEAVPGKIVADPGRADAPTGNAEESAEADAGRMVDTTVSSGSQVSSSGRVEFVGFPMAAPSVLPEKSRREA